MKNLAKAATPLEMVLKGGDANKVVLWGCGTCRMSAASFEQAQQCCAPWTCETCGKEIKSYCEDCSKKKEQAREQAAYDKATKVPYAQYGGDMLYCEHCQNYFHDVDDFFDGHQDGPIEEIPEWVWGTDEVKFHMDADDLVSNGLENGEMHEDARDNISDEAITEFQTFLDAWHEKNPVVSYFQDHSTVVILDKELEEYIAEQKEIVAADPNSAVKA